MSIAPKDWLDIEQVLVCVEDLDPTEIRASLERIVGPHDPRRERFEQAVATVLDEAARASGSRGSE